MKPLLIGYLNARGSSTPRMLRDAETVLATFADVEGYALSHVFIEPDGLRPTSALPVLIASALRCGARAIGVPTPEDLGRDSKAQELMRHRIERDTCLPVVIVQRSS